MNAGDVVQARLVGLDAVFIASSPEGARVFDIFTDIASAVHLADVFADRCPDFNLCCDT